MGSMAGGDASFGRTYSIVPPFSLLRREEETSPTRRTVYDYRAGIAVAAKITAKTTKGIITSGRPLPPIPTTSKTGGDSRELRNHGPRDSTKEVVLLEPNVTVSDNVHNFEATDIPNQSGKGTQTASDTVDQVPEESSVNCERHPDSSSDDSLLASPSMLSEDDLDIVLVPETPEEEHDSELCIVENKLYSIVPIPGKGLGFVATTNIPRGTRILTDVPVIHLNQPGEKYRPPEDQFEDLSEDDQQRVMSLHNYYDELGTLPGIVCTNAIPLRGKAPEAGLFIEASRINHACDANTVHVWNEEKGEMYTYATRDIMEGDEITNYYISGLGKYATRQRHLKTYFGFTSLPRVVPALKYIREILELYEQEGIDNDHVSKAYNLAEQFADEDGDWLRFCTLSSRRQVLEKELGLFDRNKQLRLNQDTAHRSGWEAWWKKFGDGRGLRPAIRGKPYKDWLFRERDWLEMRDRYPSIYDWEEAIERPDDSEDDDGWEKIFNALENDQTQGESHHFCNYNIHPLPFWFIISTAKYRPFIATPVV